MCHSLSSPCSSSYHTDFYKRGPLIKLPDFPKHEAEEWIGAGRQLAQQLGFDHDAMDDVQR